MVSLKKVYRPSPANKIIEKATAKECPIACKEDPKCIAATRRRDKYGRCTLHYEFEPLSKSTRSYDNHRHDFFIKKCPNELGKQSKQKILFIHVM
jgi:hypothetical protein